MPDPGARRSAFDPRWLLVMLVLTWAVSWPVIKIGVTSVPPLWFAFLRYAMAAACLFAAAARSGGFELPPRRDWPLVAVSGLLQMALYSALTGIALTELPPGRASVLAFSTPIWVVPLSAWWLGERTTRAGMIGVVLGMAGVVAIAAPSLHAQKSLAAYALLLGAAAAWATSIVYVRGHQFAASALALAPWQMLVATVVLLPVALLVEGAPRAPGTAGWAALAYVGPVATAFAYWAVVEAGRQLRPDAMAMGLLATPSLGVIISALTFGERIGTELVAGLLLIAVGIRLSSRTRQSVTKN
jgi:drug/metabolite transporter (DMT)-like permease